ncbi:hypothetical protein KSZ_60520 [Dictyobacter formicarum]|uniref:Uncharacterized protein n=1 Tax=Dictyobacter formicarum TaxID=2778368 RepID=A0ABQ3VRU0_9CHLR|nr:hypothetical protein KSZ_60520 [Dictyobacter formicarum]
MSTSRILVGLYRHSIANLKRNLGADGPALISALMEGTLLSAEETLMEHMSGYVILDQKI